MTFEQLRTLVWVARLRGFAAAAEKLNATQPSVSNRIRTLEDELGVSLFERTTRSVRITQEGKRCLAMAERILDIAKDIKESVGSKDHFRGSVTIGVSQVIAMTWLPELMAHLSGDYPLLEVEVEANATKMLFERFSAGDLDMLLCAGIPARTLADTCVIGRLGSLPYAWIASAEDDFMPIGDKPAKPADLQGLPIIAYTRHSLIHDQMDAWFRQNGARIQKIFVRCDNLSTIESLIRANLGIGLLPPSLLEDRINRGDLRVIATDPPFPPMHHYSIYARGPDTFIPSLVAETAKRVSTYAGASPIQDMA